MSFYVVADEDTVTGFQHAGIPGTVVRNAQEARDELDRLVERGEKVIVITTEQVANMVREKINAIRYGGEFPLIAEVPGPEGPSPESPSLVKMIREAVGIRL